ncbi:MAG: GntR family transcriptional regulator [Pseudomonadota bacterium]
MQQELTANRQDNDRVYLALKARAVACDFLPGEPIRLAPLANLLGVSTTPVRAALNMLAAEGLVRREPQKGFVAMSLSEERFRDLYNLNQFLLEAALNTSSVDTGVLETSALRVEEVRDALDQDEDCLPSSMPRHTGRLFLSIAALSGNVHLIEAVDRVNDNLSYVRVLESRQPDAVRAELIAICELFLAEQFDAVAGAITEYHAVRLAELSSLLTVLAD